MITVQLYTGMMHEVDTSMKERGVVRVDIVRLERPSNVVSGDS